VAKVEEWLRKEMDGESRILIVINGMGVEGSIWVAKEGNGF